MIACAWYALADLASAGGPITISSGQSCELAAKRRSVFPFLQASTRGLTHCASQ